MTFCHGLEADIMETKKAPNRLIFNINKEIHYEIKKRALKKKLTVREWLMMAIIEQIRREQIEEI